MRWWTRSKEKWQDLLAEFGQIALATYLGIAVVVFFAFVVAIRSGWQVDSATAGAGTFGAAWIALKLTQPVRIGATVALTPVVAAVVRRVRPEAPDTPPEG